MTPANALADTGYFSEAAILQAEAKYNCRVLCAIEKTGHHRTVANLEKQTAVLTPPPPNASITEQMKHRLKTREGKSLYNLRKQTVEPVFGIIREVLGFRRFFMLGKAMAELEWTLVCLSCNLKNCLLYGTAAPETGVVYRKWPAHLFESTSLTLLDNGLSQKSEMF